MQGGTQGPVQSVLQIELTTPPDDVREKVTVEGRVGGQDRLQVKYVLRGDQLVQSDGAWRDVGPFARTYCMIGIGPPFPDLLENHMVSLDQLGPCRR